jgi:hypothetical protein
MSFTVNRLSHFLKYSPLSAREVLLAAIRWGLAYMGMQNATCRLVIDDTMEHHSKGCKTIANVYWLFDHVIGGCTNARRIVFAYVIVNSIQLWKNVHESSQNKLLTVSAIIAQAESENIGNLLETLDKNPEGFREIVLSWLEMVENRRKKRRKARKILISTYTESTQDSLDRTHESLAAA